MANQYGDDSEPGIITKESSSDSIEIGPESVNNILMVGPADLMSATDPATAEQVYQVNRDSTAVSLFGPESSSLLTAGILDQLREGAGPIFAATPSTNDVTGEDHTAETSTTVSLNEKPTTEISGDFTLTLDSSDLTPQIVHDDVTTFDPAGGEAYVNPATAKVELPSAADTGTGFTADYTSLNYSNAFDALKNNQEAAEASDFLIGLQEETTVQQDVVDTANAMSSEKNYTIALVTPDGGYIDVQNYTNPYDDSRVQVEYPPRYEDGTSLLAAYAGAKANLGLNRAAIQHPLETEKVPSVNLSQAERSTLLNENVVPLRSRSTGAVIVDDPTTVTMENDTESNIQYGFQRLALDYTYEVAEENEEPFIGRLNDPGLRNALADLIADQLTAMKESDIVEAFNVRVYEETATKARLELDLDAPDPLRFIVNQTRIGQIE